MNPSIPLRGRGVSTNPANRFDQIDIVPDLDAAGDDDAFKPKTIYLRDSTRTILSRNDSPDVGFSASVNPYRGCEHGCTYCYARPTHEYLGFSSGLDFETRIMVKEDAPTLLRDALASTSYTPEVIAMSGVTDCYQPIEAKLRITRGCLEVLLEARNPVVVITKNRLVTRDIDLLGELAGFNAAAVCVTVTTLDQDLNRVLEPRTSLPRQRLQTIEALATAGIPVTVMIAPVIPGLTDHEILPIIKAATAVGASGASCAALRLPYAVAPLFERWLEAHRPLTKEKVLTRIRDMRGGRLNDSQFGTRMRGEGPFAEQIAHTFEVACRKAGLVEQPPLSVASFRRPSAGQLDLF